MSALYTNPSSVPSLSVTGNATLSGTDNTAANQTLTGDSSLVTRALLYDSLIERDFFVLSEDFATGTATDGQYGTHGWRSYQFTSATFAFQLGETNHPGILRITSGTTSGYGGLITLAPSSNIPFYHWLASESECAWVFRLNTITNVTMKIGLGNGTSSNPTRWLGLRFDTTVPDANFTFVAYDADGTENSISATSTVADTAWHSLNIRRVSASSVALSLDGGAETTISSEVPGLFGYLAPFGSITTRTAGAASIDLDFFAMWQKITR